MYGRISSWKLFLLLLFTFIYSFSLFIVFKWVHHPLITETELSSKINFFTLILVVSPPLALISLIFSVLISKYVENKFINCYLEIKDKLMENIYSIVTRNSAIVEFWKIKNLIWDFTAKTRKLISLELLTPFIILSFLLLFLYFQGFNNLINTSIAVLTGKPLTKTFLDELLSKTGEKADNWLLFTVNEIVKRFNFFLGGSVG